ncbi:MAG: transposase [Pirellulaceae bacterium]
MRPRKFKTIKHYHEPGDLHELTFSCYRQINLLTNDIWRGYLARTIEEAGHQFRFNLVAFVFMPDHVHLLVFPLDEKPRLSHYLAAVKRPVSAAVKRDLEQVGSPLLKRLTIRERPGKDAFRFWQEGPGYDRNLQQPQTVMSSIDYLHRNPVRRRLVTEARLWKWSSARFYESDGDQQEADLPRLAPMTAEYWM